MKNFTLSGLVFFSLLLVTTVTNAQTKPVVKPGKSFQPTNISSGKTVKPLQRCSTMEELRRQIAQDPSIIERWRAEGQRQYQLALERQQQNPGQRTERTMSNPIIVPIVFHLVDQAATLNSISDRDIYEQVEILNNDYAGNKINDYAGVVPPEILARVGHVPVKFVLARRDPSGNPTTGIERRVNTSPDHISIKANATGGLDAWDVTKYVNVWCGTFSGADAGLLGIATFPFTTGEGAQGVVIGITTLPYTTPARTTYYAQYSEGSTLSHEIGHYFYLWHTFGDQSVCNNDDFRIQSGWPLPAGAGPEGDDTPQEKAVGYDYFGNPSMNYKDGCAPETFGEMYGSYMNYFDDRALFMFSDGMRQRVEGCINNYRPGLLTTDGATPPAATTDAYLVNVTSRGYPERRTYLVNNTPLKAIVRNYGNTTLTSVTLNVSIDGGAPVPTTFPINLAPLTDTSLALAAISGVAGNHTFKVYTSSPNGGADAYNNNDTLYSYVNIQTATATLPFSQDFTSATFPPTGWQLWNPNPTANTWTRSTTSGSTAAGSAYFNNYNINEGGTLDELVTPAIDMGTVTDAKLTFKVAYAAYDIEDVHTWDGLEVYVSGDGGKTYTLAYKKTGMQLGTVAPTTSSFSALPTEPSKWRQETVILTPYIVSGQKMLVKFRNTNAFGNNLYVDDINVSEIVPGNDAGISVISAPAAATTTACVPVTPVVTIQNNGTTVLTSAMINVNLNGTLVGSQSWSGSLNPNATASVTLSSVPVTPAVGSNTLKIYTTLPNGVADVAPENDTATSVFTRTAGVAVPVIEGFENTTFPSTGWVLNPTSGNTWTRVTNAGSNSSSSIKADFYDYDIGTTFNLTTPFVNVAGEPVIKVSFDVAHRTYPGSADRLQVQVTNDCGASWTTIYDKTSTTGLATGAAQTGAYTPSSSSDWRKDLITLTGSILSSGIIQVRFIATSDFGNNLYIDNINIDKQYARDITPTLIVRPNAQECTAIFSPSFTIKNNGLETVTSYKAGYKLNGNTAVTQTFTTPLAPGATTTVTLPLIAAIPGTNTIKMFTADPVSASGSGDQLLLNDTLSTTFAIPTIFPNVIEGFEGSFPPANWTVLNPDNDAQEWVKHTTGRNSSYSAFIDNYNYPTFTTDQMKTPVINTVGADSIIISFDVAHKDYPGSNDVLEVLVSNDCGATFTSVYSKSGPTLATAGESTADYTAPAAGDWRRERVAVGGGLVSTGSIIVEFQNTNGYGNNIFIDNVNIIPKFKRDVEITAINAPLATTCTTNSTPSVKITNVGSEMITAVNISYSIDNGAAVTTNVTGLNIASGGTSTVSLTAATMAVGTHTFKVYSWAPVTSSGTGDQYTPNDTLSRNVYVTGTVAAPITEGFEGGTFPPSNWGIGNPDGALTWKTASIGKASASSAYMNDFNYTAAGQTDALFTPTVTYSGIDSVFLKFDVSAVTKSYPGSTETALDTLEVLLTQDCGNSFTTLYKKWGYQLQTVQDPNYPKQLQFTPATDNLWRTDSLDLTAFANSSPIQVVFRTTNNHENNIYLDNVNLYTKTLPDRLKNDGYLLLPNPFNTSFGIWHYQQPTNLRYISVYNSVGQLVWKKTFSGNADKYISIDLSNRAAGVYIVQMGYDDVNRNVTQRIVKY